jgi:hypothetical protein
MTANGSNEDALLRSFKGSSDPHWVVLRWHRVDGAPLRIAVLRSEQGFADKAEEVVDPDGAQSLVYEGADDYCQDQDVIGGVDYYYTCFARREDGLWRLEHTFHIKPKVGHTQKRSEFFDKDSPAYLQAMDRMRAGFWLSSMNRPG